MLTDSTFEDLVLTHKVTGVPAYWLKQSLELAGISLDSIRSDLNIDFTDPRGDKQRWTKVWSAGHGVGSIHKSEPLAHIARSLIDGYRAATEKPAFAMAAP